MRSCFIFLFIITSLLINTGCKHIKVEKANVDIYINAENAGWYFLELVKDSLQNAAPIEVHFTNIEAIPKAPALNFEQYNFRIFSAAGEKISHRIKLPAFVYHTEGRSFYRFYNPTPQQAAADSNWNPKGPVIEALRNQSIVALNERMR